MAGTAGTPISSRPPRRCSAAAPWVAVRGNHESCARAGQGWWRFLDGHAPAGRSCDVAANDPTDDWSAPYAVPLGGGAQLVVLDLAVAPNVALDPGDWRFAAFEATYRALADLAGRARFTFAADHQPILGFSATAKGLVGGNVAIQSVFGRHGARQLPPGVDVVLSGHYHLWQQDGFAGDVPSQFITGFSGTQEDVVPLPDPLPPGAAPAPGVPVATVASWVTGFGYMVLDRGGGDAVAGDGPRRRRPGGRPLHDPGRARALRPRAGRDRLTRRP